MPIEYKFYEKNALKTIESIQKGISSNDFATMSEKSKRDLYASIFGMRYAANAVRGKKDSLKVPVSLDAFQDKRDEMALCPTFQGFINAQGHDGMVRLIKEGHSGAAEEAFQKYVLEHAKLPADVPDRYMPTASERIKQQQKKLDSINPRSDEAVAIYAEIFRTRRAVDAVRKKGSTVEAKVNGRKYAQTEDLTNNEVFKGFVKQYGAALRSEAQTGNAGAAEEMFQDHLLKQDHIPAGAPKDYMPTAVDRIDMLKTRMKAGGTQMEQRLRCTEIMATRQAVSAVRGDKKTLAPKIDPTKFDAAYEIWDKCETFQTYLKENAAEAFEAATTGHGGKLGDKFSEHVLNLDHIPADVPDAYMPQADKRLEVLKEKYKAADYNGKSEEYKLALAAEVMATREAVKAVRGDSKSLEKPIDAKKLNEAVTRWTGCKAFQDFVKNQPGKVREGGSAGHGGLMGDKFKEFVLSRDALEGDIPIEFMPNAEARIEVLRKKIQDSPEATPEQKRDMYAELMATRSAVEAVRKKTDSLKKPVDPVLLAQEREKLVNSATFQSFVNDPERADALRDAALENRGHGGALEDQYKDYVVNLDALPEDVPERYMPTAFERTEALQKKIRAEGFDQREDAADVYAELMATRDAVNAQRGKPDTLKVTLKTEQLKESMEQWKNSEAFRAFVNDPDSGAKQAALSGHGGALAEKFQQYVKSMDVIPQGVPEKMLPDALDRIDALKSNLSKMNPLVNEPDEYASVYAQILAARTSVNAERGKKDSLKKRIDPAEVNRIADSIAKSSAFKDYLADNGDDARRKAASGHGGELEDGFKTYIRTMPRMPLDVPKEYMPTAIQRIEGLQSRIDSKEFDRSSTDVKVAVLAELIGARRSVGAERKNPKTLEGTLSAEEVKKATDKMINCSAFKEYVEKNPEAAKKAALSGHAGALEDAFKDYVKHMDKIPADVPKEFMPTALERTEILQDKIKSSAFRNKNMYEQNMVYKELVATRAAVDSVRGNKKSLDHTIDAQKLGEIRGQLFSQGTVDTFFDEANRRVLYDAATSGHGGALDDKLKEDALRQAVADGVLPPTPARFRPTSPQLRERLKENLASELKVENNPIFDAEKETAMKKVASAMYLTKLEKQARDNGLVNPVVNPEDMKTNVNTLMNSKAFKMMFDGANAARDTVKMIKDGRMASAFEVLNNNKAALQAQRQRQQEQQAQYQQEVQQELNAQQRNRAHSVHNAQNQAANRQNQQNQNQNQNQNQQEQPAVQNEQQNQQERQRQRANSVRNREQNPVVPGLH